MTLNKLEQGEEEGREWEGKGWHVLRPSPKESGECGRPENSRRAENKKR